MEKMADVEEVLLHLANKCIRLSGEERPELTWLKQIYDRFRNRYGISEKGKADSLLYERMYSSVPAKPSDTLKIRYWRTGRHLPVKREQCLLFGRALEMNERELDFLIKGYYDRSDLCFEGDKNGYPVFRERKALMEGMVMEYLEKVPPAKQLQMGITRRTLENNIRHLYYTDAMKYVKVGALRIKLSLDSHITSINYDSELARSLRLEGEVSRRTMIRHLLILGMPYMSRELMDERLSMLGYLPLKEKHTLADGSRMDWLLIRLLELYEGSCRGQEPKACGKWFQNACRRLDIFFEEKGMHNLRFMYFKALKE